MDSKITIITSTYYRNELLRETIESVLHQDYEPIEYIVVDDSGEGHAKPVLEEYDEVTPIIMEEERGWAAAYTTAFEASTGEYIQFLDDDDMLLNGKLTQTAEVLRENPDVGVSYCGVVRGNDGCIHPDPEVAGDILEHALRFQTFPLWTGSMLMKRDVLEDCMPLAGSDDHDLEIELGDTDLKIELARRTEFDYVDDCLAFYRRDGNRLWAGEKKLQNVLQTVRHQREIYDEYPELRRSLLANWYERQGQFWLEERLWTPRATSCFLKSAYYSDDNRLSRGIAAAASVFGRPGLSLAKRVRDTVLDNPQSA